jgi:hypothetical protein
MTGIGGITANSAASWINSIESAHFFRTVIVTKYTGVQL